MRHHYHSSLSWFPSLLLLLGVWNNDPAILPRRGVDAFAHPMFHSYNTYPIAPNNNNNNNNPATAEGGGSSTVWTNDGPTTAVSWNHQSQAAPLGSTLSTSSSSSSPPPFDPTNSQQQQQIIIQELQQQVSTLLHERQQLHNELKGLQHDYQVDVTALADRVEELLQLVPRATLQHSGYDAPRRSIRFDDDDVRMHQEHHHPRPLLEFHARDGDADAKEDEGEADNDNDHSDVPDPIDAQLLTLSSKGMLLTQRSSLRARLQNVANDVRSSLGGVFRRPGTHQDNNDSPFRVTIEESPDNPDLPLPEL